MSRNRLPLVTATLAAVAVFAAGCSSDTTPSENAIQVTGSATVEPITSYIAKRYNFDVNLEAVGSTDGFGKFCSGEADINDSSIAIPGEFQQQCADNKVEYLELPIGLDAITIVKHRDNDFATDLSVEQLHDIWAKDSAVKKWSDIDPAWPDEEIKLYGRPDGSGTLSVFEDLVLKGDEIREDYRATDDIQELSTWVAEDKNALSFMGIGNYLATEEDSLRLIDNVNVDGVAPTADETKKGSYPLDRPLFIYVSKKAAEREDINGFVTTYLEHAEAVMPRVYFYQLPEEDYAAAQKRFADRTTGPDARWQP